MTIVQIKALKLIYPKCKAPLPTSKKTVHTIVIQAQYEASRFMHQFVLNMQGQRRQISISHRSNRQRSAMCIGDEAQRKPHIAI
jgi:hypothetical protein